MKKILRYFKIRLVFFAAKILSELEMFLNLHIEKSGYATRNSSVGISNEKLGSRRIWTYAV